MENLHQRETDYIPTVVIEGQQAVRFAVEDVVNMEGNDMYEPANIGNIKEEWVNLTIYLPERLREEIELAFREVSYECMRAEDRDIQKLRDFYPLLVVLGLESLDRIESKDIETSSPTALSNTSSNNPST